MIAAKNFERRDVDDREATRFEQPEHFRKCGALVPFFERVEDIERRDQVECRAGKGRGRDACPHQLCAAGLAAESEPRLRLVEAAGATEATEPFDVRSRTAAAIENADRGSACGLQDEGFDECAEPVKPE